MHKFVIMGIQGSGKGTQAKLLAEDLELEHISVGDIFRWNVQHHTKIGAQVKRTIADGRLVTDDLVEEVVRSRLAEHDWNFGFVVDGFPRNARQAEFFLESYDLDGVINLHLDDSEVHRRVLARRPAREDDNPESLAVRLAAYHEQTRPLIEIFQRKEYVVTIDAGQPVPDVQAAIRKAFNLPE
jgi:adenylate kinase